MATNISKLFVHCQQIKHGGRNCSQKLGLHKKTATKFVQNLLCLIMAAVGFGEALNLLPLSKFGLKPYSIAVTLQTVLCLSETLLLAAFAN